MVKVKITLYLVKFLKYQQTMIKALLLGFMLASISNSLVAIEVKEQKIVFSFGSHNSAPYAIANGNNLVGGVIWDIANELADELNAQAVFVNIPRKRQEKYLKEGSTDVLLISNPKWLGSGGDLMWSEALFDELNVLVTLAHNSLVLQSKQDLYGLDIGTIRGYKYPLIEDDFSQKLIARYDVRELDANIGKLSLGRIDAFIDSSILVDYWLSKKENKQRFQVAPVIISKHQVYAAISPMSSVDPKKIIEVLKELKDQGVIEAVMQKYKSP